MICTGYNAHITRLLMNQQILWKLKLKSGTEVWSDFDVEGLTDPWTRAKEHCNDSGDDIVSVSVIVPGQPELTVYSDENGLNNLLILRGTAKNITDTEETIYAFMTFGRLEDDGLVHVRKFFWPECSFLQSEEIRELTPENRNLLYVKKEN